MTFSPGLLLGLLAPCQGFVMLRSAGMMPPPPSHAVLRVPPAALVLRVSLATPTMTSADKQAKAAKSKHKSSKSAQKRFKVTSTGKLLRHRAGKAHLLRKKRPRKLQALRRIGTCNNAELKTYQKLLLVKPKR